MTNMIGFAQPVKRGGGCYMMPDNSATAAFGWQP
jgi:hypothetical protein